MYARFHHPGNVWWARRSTIPRRSPYEEGALPVELQARNAGSGWIRRCVRAPLPDRPSLRDIAHCSRHAVRNNVVVKRSRICAVRIPGRHQTASATEPKTGRSGRFRPSGSRFKASRVADYTTDLKNGAPGRSRTLVIRSRQNRRERFWTRESRPVGRRPGMAGANPMPFPAWLPGLNWSPQEDLNFQSPGSKPGALSSLAMGAGWSLRVDLNHWPHGYQPCALPG